MTNVRRHVAFLVLMLLSTTAAPAAEPQGPYRYREGTAGKGRLRYVGRVPVMFVEGTPEEMGRQISKLTPKAIESLVDFPKRMLEQRGRGSQWPLFLTGVQVFRPAVPERYLAEMQSASKVSGIELERVIAANVMADVYRAFGCSSLIVGAERSATRGPLFGRNLDFFTLGYLHRYSMVSVVRPEGRHAFVSVGFPGMVGVLSGMNEKGLALAVHEVNGSKDDSALLNWLGVPYGMLFRRILEECSTVEEAQKLLEESPRTTKLNLALCDRNGGAVIEFTPKSVAMRRSAEGLCVCTNHFRTDGLATSLVCERFDALRKAGELPKLKVKDVQARLHAAHQGKRTLQSMVFEPAALRLHVSLHGQPASAGPYRTLPVGKWLAGEPAESESTPPGGR